VAADKLVKSYFFQYSACDNLLSEVYILQPPAFRLDTA